MSQDKIESRRAFMKKFGKLAGVTIAVAAFVLLFSNDAHATKNANSINSIYGLNGIQFERSTRMNQINSQNVICQNASLDRLVNGAAVQQYAQANVKQQRLSQLYSQLRGAKNQLRYVESKIREYKRLVDITPYPAKNLYLNLLDHAEEKKIEIEDRILEIEDQIQQLR